MAVMVLFSSIGLTINAHYCHSTGDIKKSILPVPLYCDHGDEMASCVIPHHPDQADACCATEAMAGASVEGECCEDYTTFLKLLSEFDLSSLKSGFNLVLQLIINLLDLVRPSYSNEHTSQAFYPNPPPLLTGKQMLVAFNQLKLDPAVL